MAYHRYAPYVPVAVRRAKSNKKMEQLRKKGLDVQPIEIEGRKIARTFWGKAWCDHLEKFSDYSNRLPRGRTYVRNGSVCHLKIEKGSITAFVTGSSLYEIEVKISPLSRSRWKTIKKNCEGQVGSLLELLQGKISKQVMEIVTDPNKGIFPSPKEIRLNCSCPDWANMCKHVAAVLYGIGARFDQQPELLFLLRGVNHNDLINENIQIPQRKSRRRQLKGDLSDVFGIELNESTPEKKSPKRKTTTKKASNQKPAQNKEKPKIIRPTGKSVARMRKRFDMNRAQFSRLLGVSSATVSKWESYPGRLTLKPESLAALTRVNMLEKLEAWENN